LEIRRNRATSFFEKEYDTALFRSASFVIFFIFPSDDSPGLFLKVSLETDGEYPYVIFLGPISEINNISPFFKRNVIFASFIPPGGQGGKIFGPDFPKPPFGRGGLHPPDLPENITMAEIPIGKNQIA
jgi:hypothetical protein